MRFASWNVNEFNESQHAPWDRRENERRAAEALARVDADVIALQEVPDADFELDGFHTCAAAKSHSGHCVVLARTPAAPIALPCGLPAAAARVGGVAVVSVHLAPGARAVAMRGQQMRAVFEAVAADERAVVLGDTNMREAEAPETDTSMTDVWKAVDKPANARFSWDSRRNDFHADAAPGGFTCRFDRAFVKGVGAVEGLRFFADAPQGVDGGGRAYLSDHFGLQFDAVGVVRRRTEGWRSVLVPEKGLYTGPAPVKPTCDGTYAPPAHREKLLSRKNAHPRDARIHFHEAPHKYVVDGDVVSKSVTGIAGELHSHFDEDDAIAKMKRKRSEPWPKLRYCLSAKPYAPGCGLPWALLEDDHTGVTCAHVPVPDANEPLASVEKRLRAAACAEVGPGTVHAYERAMTAAEIKLDWQHNRERASAEGTEAHFQMELLLNNEACREDDPEVHVGKRFLEEVVAPLGLTIFRTEWEIFYEEAHFAGSVDAIFQKPDGTLVIVDWKRSEKLPDKMSSKYRRMNPPLQHLEDCDGAKYALQLSLYRHVLERKYGFRCAELFLCSIHPTRPFHFQVPFLEKEATALVQGRVQWFSRWRAASERSSPELRCAITGRLPLEPLEHDGKLVDGTALVEMHEAMQRECASRGLVPDGSALALATRLADDGGPAFAVRPASATTTERVRAALPACEFELEPQPDIQLV